MTCTHEKPYLTSSFSRELKFVFFYNFSPTEKKVQKNFVNQSGHGGQTPPPPFSKLLWKIILHRFRLIPILGLKILGAQMFRLFCDISNTNFFRNHEFSVFFCPGNFYFPWWNYKYSMQSLLQLLVV